MNHTIPLTTEKWLPELPVIEPVQRVHPLTWWVASAMMLCLPVTLWYLAQTPEVALYDDFQTWYKSVQWIFTF